MKTGKDNAMRRGFFLPVLLLAVFFCCISYISSGIYEINLVHSQPYELTAVYGGKGPLNEEGLAPLRKLEGVLMAEPVIKINAVLGISNVKYQTNIICVDSSYLRDNFVKGFRYPDGSKMPQLVLNQTAAEEIKAAFGGENTDVPDVSGSQCTLSLDGVDGSFITRVCGIINNSTGADPQAFMSYSSAKALLQSHGKPSSFDEVRFILKNNDYKGQVTEALEPKGFSVQDKIEQAPDKMAPVQNDLIFLIIVAAICLFSASSLLITRVSILHPDIKIIRRRFADAFIISSGAGFTSVILMPYFYPPALRTGSLFGGTMPVWVFAIGIAADLFICIILFLKVSSYSLKKRF